MGYIGSFGGVLFTVSSNQILTINKLTRKTKHNFAEHKIFGMTAKLESVGLEPVEIKFEIQLLESLGVNVQESLKFLRETCAKGLVDYLTLGGEVIGEFVLEELDEETIYTDGRGKPICVTTQLTLKQYNSVGDF
jgi:phage protein U